MTQFVRVKDLDTRHHITVPKHIAEASDRLQILDGHPVEDSHGRPLPAKPCKNTKTPRLEPEPALDVREPNADENPATETAAPSDEA